MPRQAREESDTKIYNVGIKGANSQAMFLDDDDREKFIDALKDASEKYEVGVPIRLLMGNHVHLMMHGELDAMARLFKSLGASYVGYFNRKYGRTGPLWNSRYYSCPIVTTEQYMQVTGYIYHNPVKALLSKTPLEYAWSNMRALHNGDDPHGRALLAEVGDVDEILQNALDYSEGKLAENGFFDLDVFPRLRVCDADLIEYAREFLGGKSATNAVREDEEVQKSLLRDLLDLGSNVNQMSRVTAISRVRICALLA